MSDDLHTPPEVVLDPSLAATCIALIDPKVFDMRELFVGSLQQQRHARAILNVGCVHFGAQYQAARVDQYVALAAIDAFGAVIAALTADAGRPDRLAIDDARAGMRVASDADAELLAQNRVHVFPGAIETPQTEIVISSLPGWELVREQPPGAATPNNVEDGVQDLTDRMQAGTADIPGWRQQRVQAGKLGIRQVGQIRSPYGQTPAILPVKPARVPVFRQSLVLHR